MLALSHLEMQLDSFAVSVEGLSSVPVGSYKEIKLRMNEGERQRTIAATKMNETSRC